MILWVLGVTRLTPRHSLNGYFTVYCPQGAGGLFARLPSFCTAAYDSFGTIDLYLDEHLYPVDAPVVVLPAAYADRYSLFLAARPGKSAIFLNHEKAALTDIETELWFRITIGRDYMHSIACTDAPYTGTSEIEFTVEYDATDPPLAFDHCEVTGRVIAMVSDSYGASAEEEVENTEQPRDGHLEQQLTAAGQKPMSVQTVLCPAFNVRPDAVPVTSSRHAWSVGGASYDPFPE